MPSTASLIWRPRISATLCAIIPPAPVAVLPPPARGRLDRVAVLSEPGSTRARHELAIGATAETCLVGLRQSLVRSPRGCRGAELDCHAIRYAHLCIAARSALEALDHARHRGPLG